MIFQQTSDKWTPSQKYVLIKHIGNHRYEDRRLNGYGYRPPGHQNRTTFLLELVKE